MSGRRRGRPTKTGDELTPREEDTLRLIEAAPDGITSAQLAAALGVGKASADTWLNELRLRKLAHGWRDEHTSSRVAALWFAGPAQTGPSISPMLARAIPSIFAVAP